MNTHRSLSYEYEFWFQLFPVSKNKINFKNSNKIQKVATTDIKNLISAQTGEQDDEEY